jgi:hypothetical protein
VPSGTDAGAQSGAEGSTFSLSLGTVQVEDTRSGTLRTWTVTVSATAFSGSGGTIPTSALEYWSGPATASSGTIVAVPGQLSALAAQTLDSSRTAFSTTGGVGSTSVSWDPTIIVTVPSGVFSGSYTGTVTHSVA